jgi:hypothetical protein
MNQSYHFRRFIVATSLLAALGMLLAFVGVRPSAAQTTGSITIVKEANPESEQEFVFNTSILGLNSVFSLKDNGSDPNFRTFSDLPPKIYSVSENVPAGWAFKSLQCSGGADIIIGGRNASITLSAGEDVTCTYTNEKLGSIKIIKEAFPANDTEFTFKEDISNPPSLTEFKLKDPSDNTKLFDDLPPGDYTVQELVPSGWDIDDVIRCEKALETTIGVNVAETKVFIGLAAGDDMTCTFTNEAKPGRIVIEKVAPDNTTSFEFSQTVDDSGNFSLTGGSSKSFVDVDPFGQYTVTEEDPGSLGYTLADLRCSDDDSTVDLANRTATINVDPGELVTCTFTNVPEEKRTGHIFIIKDTAPAGGTNFGFEFSDGTITNTISFTLDDLEAAFFEVPTDGGTYTITEQDPGPDFFLSDIVCFSEGNLEVTINRDSRQVSVDLDSNDASVGCIFTNEELVNLTIVKKAVGGDDTFEFEQGINSGVDFADFSLTTQGGTAQTTISDLPAGYIELVEVPKAGWNFAGAECTGVTDDDWSNPDGLRINASPGDDITCTFTNEKLGSITIVKAALPEDDTEFTFKEDISNPPSLTEFKLKDPSDNTKLFDDLPPGDYSVQELVPSGWVAKPGLKCEGDGPSTSIGYDYINATVFIGLAAGDDVICTFTNKKEPAAFCPAGSPYVGDASTLLIGTGMYPYQSVTVTIKDPQQMTGLYAQLAGKKLPKSAYTSARFIPKRGTTTLATINDNVVDSAEYRDYAAFWFAANLDATAIKPNPAQNADRVKGQLFVTPGSATNMGRALILYVDYAKSDDYFNYVSIRQTDPAARLALSNKNFVYWQTAANWFQSQTYEVELGGPLPAGWPLQVQTAVVDNDPDKRPFKLVFKLVDSGGNVLASKTVQPTGPSNKSMLNINRPLFEAPAGTAKVIITLSSPNQTGDSVGLVGVAVNYPCAIDVR